MLVFHGTMGQELENAVAAKVVKINICPTVFFTPQGRLSPTNSHGWDFTPDPSLQYGNTDWRGNDCRSLSWVGPTGRYVLLRPAWELSPQIFSGGKVVATAPGPVVGAAIQRHPTTGEEVLIAVVAEVDGEGKVVADQVYTLPLREGAQWSLSGTFADYSTTTPDLPLQTTHPAHYFFNASGTQAVSVKTVVPENPPRIRYYPIRKVLLDLDLATPPALFTFGPSQTANIARAIPVVPFRVLIHGIITRRCPLSPATT